MKMSGGEFTWISAFSIDLWPLPEISAVSQTEINGCKIFILALPSGALGFHVIGDGFIEEFETVPLVSNGHLKVVLTVSYAINSPKVDINGEPVRTGPPGMIDRGEHKIESGKLEELHPLYLSDEVPATATDAEALLIRMCARLLAASESNDWYEILDASGKLRLLLLDELLARANHRHRLKIKFRINKYEPPPIDISDSETWISIYPYSSSNEGVDVVDLDEFLSTLIYKDCNQEVTVRDVIRASANSDGGIHYKEPKRESEKLVLAKDKSHTFLGNSMSRIYLKQISRIVVEGVAPLISQIQRLN